MCCVAQDDEEQPVYCNAEFMRAMPRYDDRKIYLQVFYVRKPCDRA